MNRKLLFVQSKILLYSIFYIFIFDVQRTYAYTDITQYFTLVITRHTVYAHGSSKLQVLVNGTAPGPAINITLGNSVEITVINEIFDEATTIHWHGMLQIGTPFSDGVPEYTQCLIPNTLGNNTIVYKFTPDRTGTYWYHGHFREQWNDGLFGALIVFDPTEAKLFENKNAPYSRDDTELTLLFQDSYNIAASELTRWYMSVSSGGNEPIPDATLVNGKPSGDSLRLTVSKNGGPVRMRLINAAVFSAVVVSIDGMPLTVIELDGTLIEPYEVSALSLSHAQRGSVVLDWSKLDKSLTNSSSIWLRFSLVATTYPTYDGNATNNYGIYGEFSGLPLNLQWTGLITFDDMTALEKVHAPNYKNIPILPYPMQFESNFFDARPIQRIHIRIPDYIVPLVISFYENEDGVSCGHINGASASGDQSTTATPLLYSLMKGPTVKEAGKTAHSVDYASVSGQIIKGDANTPFILPPNKIIELRINNTAAEVREANLA